MIWTGWYINKLKFKLKQNILTYYLHDQYFQCLKSRIDYARQTHDIRSCLMNTEYPCEPTPSKVVDGRAKFCRSLGARQRLISYWLASSWDGLFCLYSLNSLARQTPWKKINHLPCAAAAL